MILILSDSHKEDYQEGLSFYIKKIEVIQNEIF